MLAADPELAERRRAFPLTCPGPSTAPGRTAVRHVEELLGRIDDAAAPLADRYAGEVAELDAMAERLGERGRSRRPLEKRHTRGLRRHRTDELRSGLALLAASYRDTLVGRAANDRTRSSPRSSGSKKRSRRSSATRTRALLLQSLLWSLPAEPGVTR